MHVMVRSRSSAVVEARSTSRAPWRLIALLALLLGLLALPSAARGAGELDPSFGAGGKVVSDFGGEAFGVAIQTDGKIVAAGESTLFTLARYNPDGSPDASFNGDGRVETDFGAFGGASDVAIQADGKIVAVGRSETGFNTDFALARYNPDGSLDASFGAGGKVLTAFAEFEFATAHGVAIQADGKIVAVGENRPFGPGDFALARYNPDGSLDASFGAGGKVLTDFGSDDGARDVAIQADGKLVAAGVSGPFANEDFALARYNPDGSPDASFNGDGRVVTDFGAAATAHGVAIQADGKIVAAGVSGPFDSPFDFALARYHADGSLDSTFDGDGKVLTDLGGDDFARDVAIQADGKIVAAGRSGVRPTYDFALARYLPDGAPLNLPPDCSTVAASPNRLGPPNHRFRLISLTGATDPDGDTVTLTIAAVTQDEPLNGEDDGNTSPDARRASAENQVFLRAERSGGGDGRVYRVSFTGSDGKGGSCEGRATVAVPHDQGKAAVDSAPPSYNSFGP